MQGKEIILAKVHGYKTGGYQSVGMGWIVTRKTFCGMRIPHWQDEANLTTLEEQITCQKCLKTVRPKTFGS